MHLIVFYNVVKFQHPNCKMHRWAQKEARFGSSGGPFFQQKGYKMDPLLKRWHRFKNGPSFLKVALFWYLPGTVFGKWFLFAKRHYFSAFEAPFPTFFFFFRKMAPHYKEAYKEAAKNLNNRGTILVPYLRNVFEHSSKIPLTQ